jgi:hypothetical protein
VCTQLVNFVWLDEDRIPNCNVVPHIAQQQRSATMGNDHTMWMCMALMGRMTASRNREIAYDKVIGTFITADQNSAHSSGCSAPLIRKWRHRGVIPCPVLARLLSMDRPHTLTIY